MSEGVVMHVFSMSTEDLATLPIEELEKAIAELQKQSQQEEQQIEENKQEMYSTNIKINKFMVLELDCKEEIEFMKDDDAEYKELELKVQNLEEQKRIIQATHEDKMNIINQEMATIDEEINKSEEHLSHLKQIRSNTLPNNANESVSKETLELETIMLAEEIEHVQGHIDVKTKANQVLQHKIKEVNDELECLQETVQYTSEELNSMKENVKELQAEISLLRVEIESHKSTPLEDASRGNSLFAEVHDRKVHLESKLTFMKTHYVELQNEHAELMQQIKTLSAENTQLAEIYKLDMDVAQEQNENALQYDKQLEALKAEYWAKRKMLDEPFKSKAKDISDEELKALMHFYQNIENKLLKMLDELLSSGESHVILAKDLAEVNTEMRNLRFDVDQVEAAATKLKAEHDALCIEKKFDPKCKCKKALSNKFNLLTFVKK